MSLSANPLYRPGDHVCTLYGSRKEQASAAVAFVHDGLLRRERCIYVTGEHTVLEFRRLLRDAGIDVAAEEARGALVILTKEDAPLQGGSFAPERMLDRIRAAALAAVDDGFAALRVAVDMTWLLAQAPGSHQFVVCEAMLNYLVAEHPAIVLCQYDRRRLPHAALDHGIATHPLVFAEARMARNPFYEQPDEARGRTPAPPAAVQGKLAALRHLT